MHKGTIIYQTDSPLGPISVSENRKTRWIAFDNDFVQTIINKKRPYLPLLRYLPAMCCIIDRNKDSVLSLGTGGGGLLHYLKYYHPNKTVETVEISPEMIHIARTYFDIQHPITQACAYEYVKHCDAVSHIMVDLLTGCEIPTALTNDTFYQHCKDKAYKTITFNLITKHNEQAHYLLNKIRQTFESRTLCLSVKTMKNIIVHAFTSSDYLSSIEKLANENRIAPPIWDEHYGVLSELI